MVFNKLAENGEITQRANGALVASLGNDTFVTFREATSQQSDFVPGIDVNAPSILGSDIWKLKFYP
jgi:hypothetical protein